MYIYISAVSMLTALVLCLYLMNFAAGVKTRGVVGRHEPLEREIVCHDSLPILCVSTYLFIFFKYFFMGLCFDPLTMTKMNRLNALCIENKPTTNKNPPYGRAIALTR